MKLDFTFKASYADFYPPVIPPLALMYCPVTQRLKGEARKSTTSATSLDNPIRLSSLVKPTSICTSGLSGEGTLSVATGPGATLLTFMPYFFPN